MTHATSAEKGLEMAALQKPDIILMDLQLPGLNGYDAFKLLQADSSLSDTPVIAISADLNPVNVDRAIQMGFHEYFTKPIDILNLLSALDSIADGLT